MARIVRQNAVHVKSQDSHSRLTFLRDMGNLVRARRVLLCKAKAGRFQHQAA